MPGDPLNITIALKDAHEGDPPAVRTRNYLADIHRQEASDFGSFVANRETESQRDAGQMLLGLMQHGAGAVGGGAGAATQKAYFRGRDIQEILGGGPKARAAGGAAAALSLMSDAALKTREALNTMAEGFRNYSAPLSKALAEREVAQTMFEISEARKYGGQLSEQVRIETDFSIQLQKLENAIKMMGRGAITDLEKVATEWLKWLNDKFGGMNVDAFDEMNENLEEFLEHARDLGWEAKVEKAEANARDGIQPFEEWMKGDEATAWRKRRDEKAAAAEKKKQKVTPENRATPGWQWRWPWEGK